MYVEQVEIIIFWIIFFNAINKVLLIHNSLLLWIPVYYMAGFIHALKTAVQIAVCEIDWKLQVCTSVI